jgi:hypothetical protein
VPLPGAASEWANEYIVLCAAGGDLSLSPERAAKSKSSRQLFRSASSSKLPQRRSLAALRDPPRLRLAIAPPLARINSQGVEKINNMQPSRIIFHRRRLSPGPGAACFFSLRRRNNRQQGYIQIDF